MKKVTNNQMQQPSGVQDLEGEGKRAPAVVSINNVYVAWWANSTGNDEVMFRASSDAGQNFGDKINLSNTTSAESQDAEISAQGHSVIIS
jgi:peroxiredoxin